MAVAGQSSRRGSDGFELHETERVSGRVGVDPVDFVLEHEASSAVGGVRDVDRLGGLLHPLPAEDGRPEPGAGLRLVRGFPGPLVRELKGSGPSRVGSNGWMGHLVQMAANIFCAGFIVTLCERLRSTSKRSYGRRAFMPRFHCLLRSTGRPPNGYPVTSPLSPLYDLVMVYSVVSGASTTELRKTWRWIACRTGIAPRHGVVGREAR